MKVSINKDKFLRILGMAFLFLLGALLTFEALRRGIYSSKMGFNLVVVGENGVGVLLLRPDEDIVNWVDLPENLKIKIYNSAAVYPVGSLWKYGESERRPFEIVEKSLGLSMGVVLPRIIKVDGEATIEEVLASLHKLSLKTDLSFRDRWAVRQFLVETVTAKKVLELTIPKSAFDPVVEPDGKEFLVFNSVASLWIKNKFVLEPVLNENVDISVNNISGQTGMGLQLSKQLESAGLRVVEVKADESDSVLGTGCLFTVKGNFPMTSTFLINQLLCTETPSSSGAEKGIKLWLK